MASWVAISLLVAITASACAGDGAREGSTASREEGVAYATVDGRQLLADVYRPSSPSGASAVILHGQGGDRTSAGSVALGQLLRDRGILVVIADYDTASPRELAADAGAGLARAARQARCAVALALASTELGAPGRSIIVGESAGGLVGFVAATRTDADLRDPGEVECSSPSEGNIDALVSWNGALFIFHPSSPFHDSAVWDAVDPHGAARSEPSLELWLGLGGADDRTPGWHVDLVSDLAAQSDAATLAVRPAAGHEIPTSGPDLDALADLVVAAATEPTQR